MYLFDIFRGKHVRLCHNTDCSVHSLLLTNQTEDGLVVDIIDRRDYRPKRSALGLMRFQKRQWYLQDNCSSFPHVLSGKAL